MIQVDREATFRGPIVSHAVSLTKNEYPQWVAELKGIEVWDDEEKVWVDWTDVEQNGALAYLVLFGSKGETLTCTQVKKATGWDGLSFSGLNDMDLSETVIQFRMEYDTYNDKTTLQVAWIDEYDATPGTAIKTLKPDEIKALDAKFKQFMTKAAPATAPATGKPTTPGKVKAKGAKPTQKAGPVKKVDKPKAPAELPTVSPPELPAMPEAESDLPDLRENKRTKKAAWESCVELRQDKITDKKLGDTWLGAIKKVSGGHDPDVLTEEQWYEVEQAVLEVVAKF